MRDRRRADGDAGVERAIEPEVTDRARVRAALIRLELGDALHRADLGRAGDRTGRKTCAERVERVELRIELTLDDRRQMHHVGEAVDPHELLNLYRAGARYATDVVTRKVHQHHVLRPLLLRRA